MVRVTYTGQGIGSTWDDFVTDVGELLPKADVIGVLTGSGFILKVAAVLGSLVLVFDGSTTTVPASSFTAAFPRGVQVPEIEVDGQVI